MAVDPDLNQEVKGKTVNLKGVNNMPGFDGTGPQGFGPLTGRGIGRCLTGVNGFSNGTGRILRRVPGLGVTPSMGRGLGLGALSGLGRGLATVAVTAALLGIGYGCARVYSRYIADNEGMKSKKRYVKATNAEARKLVRSDKPVIGSSPESTNPTIE